MNVKPLSDRVIVKPLAQTEEVKGGIVIPDTAKEKPQEGTVVAIGPGRISETGKKVEMELKEGDTVVYGRYAGTEVTIDNEEYLIMRESDVLAVLAE